jgi:signal transduction histidine kinase
MTNRCRVVGLVGSLLGLLVAAPALGDEIVPLSSIAAVKAEAMDSVAQRVRVRGVVTVRQGEGFVIQDDDAGIWIDVTNARKNKVWLADDRILDGVVPGAEVQVVGDTSRGGFAPTIQPVTLQIVGQAGMPESPPADMRRFFSGGDDCLRVTIEGVVRRVTFERHDWGDLVALLVCTEGRCSRVTIPRDACPFLPEQLLDAHVCCTGVATARFNARGEILSPMLHMLGNEDLIVEQRAPGGPFEAPLVSLSAIAQYRPAELDEHRIRTRGVVTMSRPGEFLYVQSGAIGVRVETASETPFELGEFVEAAGFVDRGPLCAALVEAEVRRIDRGETPEPADVDPENIMEINRIAAATFSVALPGDYFGALVRMAGRLVETHATARGTECLVAGEDHTFVVMADGGTSAALRAVDIGSMIAVSGILRPVARTVEDPMSPAWLSPVERLEVLARNATDVRVLAAAPWWTPRRLWIALGAAATLAAGGALWVVVLRRQIAAQLRVIRAQLESRATLEERQRIAREFHDTLEQDLASITLQADAAAHCTADAEARQAFAEHRNVMARLRQETHDFLWDLRDPMRCDGSLAESVAAQAAYLRSLTDIPIACDVADDLPRVPADVQFHLLRIVREATRNAMQHGEPSRIDIQAGRDGDDVTITVRDDGRGFSSPHVETLPGHFGLLGMRERARRIGATVLIESAINAGTAVRVVWGSQSRLAA